MTKMLSLTPAEMHEWPAMLELADPEAPRWSSTATRLERAKERLAGIDAIGLQERFEDFCDELTARFGWDLGEPERVNTTEPVEVSEGFRARIAEDNAFDLELYEFAQGLLRDTGRLPERSESSNLRPKLGAPCPSDSSRRRYRRWGIDPRVAPPDHGGLGPDGDLRDQARHAGDREHDLEQQPAQRDLVRKEALGVLGAQQRCVPNPVLDHVSAARAKSGKKLVERGARSARTDASSRRRPGRAAPPRTPPRRSRPAWPIGLIHLAVGTDRVAEAPAGRVVLDPALASRAASDRSRRLSVAGQLGEEEGAAAVEDAELEDALRLQLADQGGVALTAAAA